MKHLWYLILVGKTTNIMVIGVIAKIYVKKSEKKLTLSRKK